MLTTTTTITTDWRDLADCRDSEPTLFFPVGTTGPAIDQIEAAIAICMTCPVQESCLQYALETNQESGVWGGYAEDDRRRLRKRWLAERRRRACLNSWGEADRGGTALGGLDLDERNSTGGEHPRSALWCR